MDEQYVGVWAYTDHGVEYAPVAFADNTDFYIPPMFTQGKTEIDVILFVEDREPIGYSHPTSKRIDYNVNKGFGFTAFHYWIYSIVV